MTSAQLRVVEPQTANITARNRAEHPSSAKQNMVSIADYVTLLKPRVISLVVFTAYVGMMMAPDGIQPLTALTALFGTAGGAGAAGAFNMWYDANIDAAMVRRPVPIGRISPNAALAFGLVLSLSSVGILGFLVNWLAAAPLAYTIFFYVVIYTMWLKRWTPQKIVIGTAAGTAPPMIRWAAATGNVGLERRSSFSSSFSGRRCSTGATILREREFRLCRLCLGRRKCGAGSCITR